MSKLDAHPLIQRWRGFLAKIGERLGEIEAESEQGLRGLIEQDPFDYMAYQNALTGLDARVRGLRDKLQSTWDDSVEDKILAANESNHGIFDHALDHGGPPPGKRKRVPTRGTRAKIASGRLNAIRRNQAPSGCS